MTPTAPQKSTRHSYDGTPQPPKTVCCPSASGILDPTALHIQNNDPDSPQRYTRHSMMPLSHGILDPTALHIQNDPDSPPKVYQTQYDWTPQPPKNSMLPSATRPWARIFLDHIGGTRLFSCANCDTILTNPLRAHLHALHRGHGAELPLQQGG
ncbi:unnamed protein product [Ranitomeya imitator]|uniref:C2H2-type domain-containing protein n=1 Tax=Ranitomeya imitator TaxID=111125 RepID=A0ABN9LLT5_9NEOB|nr:unnamed protein product [Ranitomeya imitator]